jgi:hypothetical protein
VDVAAIRTWNLDRVIWFAMHVRRRPYCAIQVPYCQVEGGNLRRGDALRGCCTRSTTLSASSTTLRQPTPRPCSTERMGRPMKSVPAALLGCSVAFFQFGMNSHLQSRHSFFAVFLLKVENDAITSLYIGYSTGFVNIDICLRKLVIDISQSP